MKILKRGEMHKWKVYKLRCPLCGTEVEILKGDPEIIEYYDSTYSYREDVKWKCPICAMEVDSSTPSNRAGDGKNHVFSGVRQITPEERAEINSWNDTVYWQENEEERNYDKAMFRGTWDNKG